MRRKVGFRHLGDDPRGFEECEVVVVALLAGLLSEARGENILESVKHRAGDHPSSLPRLPSYYIDCVISRQSSECNCLVIWVLVVVEVGWERNEGCRDAG